MVRKIHFKVAREDHALLAFSLSSYHNMCFLGVQSLKFRLKNWMLPMFKKTQNLIGLTVNLVLGLLKQCSRVHFFAFL